jgi:hypothetical protein
MVQATAAENTAPKEISTEQKVAALEAEIRKVSTEQKVAALERELKRLREGIGDAASAQDATVTWPSKKSGSDGSNIRHIGLPSTPFEKVQDAHGNSAFDAKEEEEMKSGNLGEEEEARTAGSSDGLDPNAQPTNKNDTPSAAYPAEESPEYPKGGTTGDSDAKGDQGDEIVAGEENGSTYGFTKEDWSTFSKTEKRTAKALWEKAFTAGRKRALIERSGVKNRTPISTRRESRDGGKDIVPGGNVQKYGAQLAEYVSNIDFKIPNLQEHLDVMHGVSGRVHALTRAPMLKIPKIGSDIKPRLEFLSAIQDWTSRISETYEEARVLTEAAPAIATTTTGAAIGVEEMTPALVVPTNLAALLRDTYLYKALPQGTDRARFQTVTALAMGALTQNTAPSSTAPTLNTVDVTTAPRGYLIQVSFEAERRVIGPLLDALILAGRLGELYDEDYLAVGASQAFESAAIPTTGGLYGTGNQIFGTGVTAEVGVTSTMTMSLDVLTDVQETVKAQGYSPDNIVVIMAPKQFRDLMRDSNLTRYVQFGPGFDQVRGMLGQGVIPEVLGMEIRQSTLPVQRASGSGGLETYHAWAYKKGLTAALAASRDVMIETFRDIEAGSTWLKVHYDMGVGVLHPNSLVEAVTA